MFFAWILSIVVGIMVGGLFWWNVSLISDGKTYLDFLVCVFFFFHKITNFFLQRFGTQRGCIQTIVWPFGAPNFKNNWRRFLGLTEGRTFACHVLLPSSHGAKPYEEEDDEGSDLIEEIVVV